jgi:mannose-6-phosphate isomerase
MAALVQSAAAFSILRNHFYFLLGRQEHRAPRFYRCAQKASQRCHFDQNEAGAMAIEHARAHSLPKPWGVLDTRPWSSADQAGRTIGEVWYERSGSAAIAPALLLKLLFTDEPLSIQVHPDDAYAQSIGQLNGKTEAWYVLGAAPGAKVALGLKRRLTPQQLRHAVEDGSISDIVGWQSAYVGDTVFVAAGTIHAIGAGLVIAEIQQRSDATFRLFDHGRGRELHIENAIAVADAGPAGLGAPPNRLTETRTLLTSNPYFTFERIDLSPGSAWRLDAERETWLLAIGGSARAGSFDLVTGEAVFAESDRVDILAGEDGLSALVAYTGGPVPELLACVDMETIQ